MAQKVEDWIKKRVGLCLLLNSNTVGEKLYSGYVFYHLLRSYNVLNPDCMPEPKKSCNAAEAKNNLISLAPWLKVIGVNPSTRFLDLVSKKSNKQCVTLLLHIYRRLEDSNCIHTVTNQMKNQILSRTTNRFKVTKNPSNLPLFTFPQIRNDLETPLITNKHIIKRFKEHKKRQDEEFKEQVRVRRLKMAERNKAMERVVLKFPRKFEPKSMMEGNESGKDPIRAFVDSCEDRNLSQELFLNCSPQEHVNYLRQKRVSFYSNELLRLKMHNMLLHDMWAEILSNNESDFESFFGERLCQQSECEKNLCLRLARVNCNYKSFFEQKQLVNDVPESEECYWKQQSIIEKREADDKDEKMRLLQLHRKFKEDKSKKRLEFIEETCQDIVNDLVDLAVYLYDRFGSAGVSPTRSDVQDYKGLFYKGVPFYESNGPEITYVIKREEYVTSNMTYQDIRNIDNLSLRNRVAEEILNNFYSQSYLDCTNMWSWKSCGMDNLTENSNIHGFIINRLLEFKYPFPAHAQPPKFSHFKIRTYLRNFQDQEFIDRLSALLKKFRVAVVRLNDAVNYCLRVYETEKNITPFGRTLQPEPLVNEQSTADADTSTQPNAITEVPSEIKAIGMDSKRAKYFRARMAHHKAIQCPSVEDLHKRFKHSTPALLGKIAFETLNRGEILNETLAVKMVVEYLKTLTQEEGFVLVDFPNSVSQAALLEYLITGVPVDINFPMDYDDKELIFQEMEPPLSVDSRLLVDFEDKFSYFINEKTFAAMEKFLPFFYKTKMMKKIKQVEENEEDESTDLQSSSAPKVTGSKHKSSKILVLRKTNPLVKHAEPEPVIDNDYYYVPIYQEREKDTDTEPPISLKDLMMFRKSKILPMIKQGFSYPGEQKLYFQSCIANLKEKTGKKEIERKCSSIFCNLHVPIKKSIPADFGAGSGVSLMNLAKNTDSNAKTGSKSLNNLNVNSELIEDQPKPEPSTTSTQLRKKSILRTSFSYVPNVDKPTELIPTESEKPKVELPSPLIFFKYCNIPITFVEVQGNIPIKSIARLILKEPEEKTHLLRRNSADLFGSNQLRALSIRKNQFRSHSDIDVLKRQIHETPKEQMRNKQLEALTDIEIIKPMTMNATKRSAIFERRRISAVERTSAKSIKVDSTDKGVATSKPAGKAERRQSKKGATAKSRKSSMGRRASKSSKSDTHKSAVVKSEASKNQGSTGSLKYIGPKPGEAGWIYHLQPIPDKLQVALATIWEVVEHVYLRNLHSVLEIIKLFRYKLSPLRIGLKAITKEFLEKPDDKLNMVNNFQLMVNAIDNDFRRDSILKAELHYRVKELQEILNDESIQKYEDAKKGMNSLFPQGWETASVYQIVNNYYDIMQIECDRYVDTLNIFHDYYIAMLMAKLGDHKIEKITLPKLTAPPPPPPPQEIKTELLTETESDIGLKKPKKKKIRHSSFADEELLVGLRHISINANSIQTAIGTTLLDLITKAKHTHSRVNDVISDENIGKELRQFLLTKELPDGTRKHKTVRGSASKRRQSTKMSGRRQSRKKSTGGRRQSRKKSTGGGDRRQSSKKSITGGGRRQSAKKSIAGGGRRQSSKKSISGGGRRKSAKKSISGGGRRKSSKKSISGGGRRKSSKKSITGGRRKSSSGRKKKGHGSKEMGGQHRELDQVDFIKMEWKAAVQNELDRLVLRLKLIECKIMDEVNDIFKFSAEANAFFQNVVTKSYEMELQAIEDMALVFKAAIEDEVPIQPLMILDKGRFYIDRSNLLFPDVPPPPPEPLDELISNIKFTIKQLEKLLTKLNFICPYTMVQETFISFLEDLVLESSSIEFSCIPSKWRKLKRADLESIVNWTFGSAGIIQWKDFILFNLNIPLPKLVDLLELRESYMKLDPEGYETITFEQYMDVPLWFDRDFGETIHDDLRMALAKELLFKIFQVSPNEMNYSSMLLAFSKDEELFEGFMMALILIGSHQIIRDKACYQVPFYPHIEGSIIVQQLMKEYFAELNDLIDGIEVKYLPKHRNEEIYGSFHNEYLITEEILQTSIDRKFSADSLIEDPTNNKHDGIVQMPDVALTGIYIDERWKVCVPYKLALTLLISSIQSYGISKDHLHDQLALEKRLNNLYETKGKDGYIKAYNLVDNDIFKELFETVHAYRWYDVTGTAEKYIQQIEAAEAALLAPPPPPPPPPPPAT